MMTVDATNTAPAQSTGTRHLYNWKYDDGWEREDHVHDGEHGIPQAVHVHYDEHEHPTNQEDGTHPISTLFQDNLDGVKKYSIGLLMAVLVIYFLVKLVDRERRKREHEREILEISRDGATAKRVQAQLDKEMMERKQRLLDEVTTVVKDTENVDLESLEAGTHTRYTSKPPSHLQDDCAICLSEYVVGDKVTGSPGDECHHAFHYDCILDWLSRDNKNCPCCRKRFIPEEYFVKSGKVGKKTAAGPSTATLANTEASDDADTIPSENDADEQDTTTSSSMDEESTQDSASVQVDAHRAQVEEDHPIEEQEERRQDANVAAPATTFAPPEADAESTSYGDAAVSSEAAFTDANQDEQATLKNAESSTAKKLDDVLRTAMAAAQVNSLHRPRHSLRRQRSATAA